MQRSLAGQSGMWPSLLPQLRNRARLKRADLVAELADRLGAAGQSEKVGAYYHQMEQGLLPASGVSDSVLEALGRIVGAGKEALRKAGEMPAAGAADADPAARCSLGARLRWMRPPRWSGASAAPEEWDEVDRLFRGG